jgi:hypothetical protein
MAYCASSAGYTGSNANSAALASSIATPATADTN